MLFIQTLFQQIYNAVVKKKNKNKNPNPIKNCRRDTNYSKEKNTHTQQSSRTSKNRSVQKKKKICPSQK